MKTNKAQKSLVILLVLLGTGAIFGGGVLIISPSGELLNMPLSLLENSPFNNFLIPGIILFSVIGLVPIGLAVALVKKPESKLLELCNFYSDMHWAWTYSIYVGFALIIWIQLKMVFLREVHWLHTLYMFFAILILYVALLPQVRSQYKK